MTILSINMAAASQPFHVVSVVLATQDTVTELHPKSSYCNPAVWVPVSNCQETVFITGVDTTG